MVGKGLEQTARSSSMSIAYSIAPFVVEITYLYLRRFQGCYRTHPRSIHWTLRTMVLVTGWHVVVGIHFQGFAAYKKRKICTILVVIM